MNIILIHISDIDMSMSHEKQELHSSSKGILQDYYFSLHFKIVASYKTREMEFET